MIKFLYKLLIQSLKLLSSSQRRRGLVIFLLSVILVFLDLISLVSILPLLFAYSKPEALENSDLVQSLFASFSFENTQEFLRVAIFFIFLLFLFKTCFSYAVTKWKANFTHGISRGLLIKLHKRLIYEKVIKYEKETVGEVIRNIIHIPELFTIKVIRSFLELFVNLIVSLIVLIALISYEKDIFLYLIVILFPAILVYFIYQNKRLNKIKSDIEYQYPAMIQWVVESAEGKLDILLTRSFDYFKGKVLESSRRFFDAIIKQNIALNSSAKLIEFIAITGVCVLFYIFTYRPEEHDELFTLLSIYTISAYRLIPALNQIGTSFTNIKLHEFTVQHLIQDQPENIFFEAQNDSNPLCFENKIEFRNLNYRSQNSGFCLKNLNIEIHKGERIALVGESGSGKTTLIKLLLGVLQTKSNSIFVDAVPLTKKNILSWQKNIAYVPQEPFIFNATLFDNITMGASYSRENIKIVSDLTNLLELTSMINDNQDGLMMKVGESGAKLSGGQRQRISIARALYQNKPIMIFDEATSNLDQINRNIIYQIISNKITFEKTVLFITHQMDSLDYCDRIIDMEKLKNEQ